MSSHRPEIDSLSGEPLTPHEWDGIRELDTPPPRWWLLIYAATIVFSVGYWVVYPAWPTMDGFTRGLFGWSSRGAVAEALTASDAARAGFETRIQASTVEEIEADPELLRYAMAGGRAAFLDNCAQCHGTGAQGQAGFPSLIDDDWLWGGTAADIEQTIRYGIRSTHPETRFMEMPAFGADQLLSRDEIADVADYVLTLSGAPATEGAARGAEIFAANCASCHGERGEGSREMGAPRLSDGIWLYGGEREDIIRTVTYSRRGVMPHWEDRLSPEVLKKLTVFVHSLGGGE